MDSIKYIIVDDEPDACELLRLCLEGLFPQMSITGMFNNWKDAYQAIKGSNVDLLFIDISMPEKNGFELLTLLPDINAEIVFTTAHSEYALNAFQFSPAGYLLKPIADAELVKVINKVMERVQYKNIATQQGKEMANKIGIFNNKGIDYVDTTNIIYLESANKCTKVVTMDNEYVSSYYLGKFKSLLPDNFYQVHRSFIVNMDEVIRYESSGLALMSNKAVIPIARDNKEQFLKMFRLIGNP